jgi:HAD superfamily hydrolase (TIGR01484 family)
VNLKINAILADYDGTLAPINVSREQSKPSKELLEALKQSSEKVILGVISMKDYWFLKNRIPFAHTYGCIGGLEIITRKKAFIRKPAASKLEIIKKFYDYVNEHHEKSCIKIEIKKLINKKIAGLSLDWRNCQEIPPIIQHLKNTAKHFNLHTINYNEPFIDIIPIEPNKGTAVKFIKQLFKIKGPILYLGDSTLDNPAFKTADISIGVISHNDPKLLEAQFLIDFKDVPKLLKHLIKTDMTFTNKLPLLKRGATQ